MFSMAVTKMEMAIKGSIICESDMINPEAANPKAKLWAIVKTEH